MELRAETIKLTLKKAKLRWPAAWVQPYLKSGAPTPLRNISKRITFLLKCRWIISPNTAFLLLILHHPQQSSHTEITHGSLKVYHALLTTTPTPGFCPGHTPNPLNSYSSFRAQLQHHFPDSPPALFWAPQSNGFSSVLCQNPRPPQTGAPPVSVSSTGPGTE